MLHLKNKEYDLNTLFSFEVLKEILLKLARSQDKLEGDINIIRQNISKRDQILFKLEKAVFNTTSESELNQDDFNQNEIEQNEEEDNNYYENNNKEDIIQEKEYDNKRQKEVTLNIEKNKYEKSNDIKNENIQNESNASKNLPQNKSNETEQKLFEKKISDKNKSQNNNISSSNQLSKSGKEQSTSGISPDLFSKMMKQLKEQQAKINMVETKIKSNSNDINNLENKLKNHVLDNESQIKLINERINSLLQKNGDYDKKIEDLQVKASELDVFSMFKDNGDGTIDATKVLVKALEEKIFKKFELVDARYKKDSLDNLKVKTNVENITPKLDQFQRELERINDINKQQKEDLDNYKKENEEQNLDNLNNVNNDFNQKISELKNDLEKNLKNSILLIENQLKNMKNDSGGNNNNNEAFDLLKLSLGNNGLDSEFAQTLEKKINDLRKKMNDLENTLKLSVNAGEIDSLKKEIKDMKLLLDKKVSRDDLKELYNFHLADVDELNDIKDRESIINDDLRKTIKDVQNIQQRLESINGNLALLLSNPSNGNSKIIDFSKYIDNQKLSDSLKPFFKEFEKIFKEIDSFRRDLGEMETQNKNNLKNLMSKVEEDMINKINELKAFIHKKYLEKMEFHKTIKTIEVQIKSMGDDSKKADADSWLLAKRPLKCFNCASCEANIKNENYNTADYLPWKKYPRGEKIHRMGQGFSHMLQMMTSEFIKSIEKTDIPMDFDATAKNNNNSTNYNASNVINDKAAMSGFVINNKEQIPDDGFQNLKKNYSKMRLPKVKQYSKPKLKRYEEALPISDEEFTDNNDINKETIPNRSNSPKILKITKKNKPKMLEEKSNTNKNLMTIQTGFIQKDNKNIGFGRNYNTIKTEKNENMGTFTISPKN